MTTLVPIDGGRGEDRAKSTAESLRELADLIEAGRGGSVVAIAVVDGAYRFESNVSIHEGIALSAVLHAWAVRKVFR